MARCQPSAIAAARLVPQSQSVGEHLPNGRRVKYGCPPVQLPLVSHSRTSSQTKPTFTLVRERVAGLMLCQLPCIAGVEQSADAVGALTAAAPKTPAMAITVAIRKRTSLCVVDVRVIGIPLGSRT